jgi:MAM domain, meprin/A5/mu
MMYGNGIDKLEVHVRRESESFGPKTLLWKSKGSQAKIWFRKELIIEVVDEALRIAFDGFRTIYNPRGLIACMVT